MLNEQMNQNVVEGAIETVISAFSGRRINECEAIFVENYGYIHCDEEQEAIDEGTLICCHECGELIRYDDSHTGSDTHHYCESCFNEIFTICDHCGSVVRRDETIEVHAGMYRGSTTEDWCSVCVEDDAEQCEDCDEYFYRNEMYEVDDVGYICGSCFDGGDYVCCESCGHYFNRDDCEYDEDSGCWYCNDCQEAELRRSVDRFGLTVQRGDDRVIHGYHSYDYAINFKGERDRNKHLHIGVELEIDKGGQNGTKARTIVEAGGYEVDTDIICMRDGSLHDGVELISMPATLDYHRHHYNWPAMMAKAVELEYRSHDVNTCGLHMHIDRYYFSGSMTNPEEAFCILLNNNNSWIRTFSRRSNWHYCEPYNAGGYTFTVDMFKGKDERLLQNAQAMLSSMRRYYQGHSSALNFSNYSTIEIRIFKGTLKFSTLIASMQLVEMMAYAAKHFRLEQLCNVDYHWFKRFAEKRGYQEYLQYLTDRAILG